MAHTCGPFVEITSKASEFDGHTTVRMGLEGVKSWGPREDLARVGLRSGKRVGHR